jgi:AAA+ superfamily predicted ATPase
VIVKLLQTLLAEASLAAGTSSMYEFVFRHFINALNSLYGKDWHDYSFATLMETDIISDGFEHYLKDKGIPYTVKGFSAPDCSELPVRGFLVVEGYEVSNVSNFGIFHLNPDTAGELYIYVYGPFERMSKRLTFVAYRSIESVNELVRGVKLHYAAKIKQEKHILFDGEEKTMDEVRWEDVILPESIYRKIRLSIESFLKSRHIYQRLSVPYKRGILFAGAPGNGKTLLCRAIAWQCNLPFIVFPLTENSSDSDLDRAFDLAHDLAPAILCFEDLDSVKKSHISLSYFLNKIDGFESLDGIMVLATTNRPEDIDIALSNRPSRFDSVFRINNPDEDCRHRMLKRYLNDTIEDGVLMDIVAKTQGFSMAYLKELYLLSAMIAVDRDTEQIRNDDLYAALEVLKQQILTGNKPLDDENKRLGFIFSK